MLDQEASLNKEVESALNEQIKFESQAAANYLAMAAWCDANGYENCSNFFFNQSGEERQHMLKIFKYMSDEGSRPIIPMVEQPKQEFTSLQEVFSYSLSGEIQVTKAIHKLIKVTRDVEDFTTENFMQWFVKEQREEEQKMRRVLDLFKVIKPEELAPFMVDDRITKIASAAADNNNDAEA